MHLRVIFIDKRISRPKLNYEIKKDSDKTQDEKVFAVNNHALRYKATSKQAYLW